MPKWGLTMTEGKVVGWLKQEGQGFAEGEELLEIETTKITNVFEAPTGGTLRRIVRPPARPCRSAVARRSRPRGGDGEPRSTISSPGLRPPADGRSRERKPKQQSREKWRSPAAPALSRARRGRQRPGLAGARLWRRSQHLDVHPACSGRGKAGRRGGFAGTRRIGQETRARRCGRLAGMRRARARGARHRTGASRRTFDGRRHRRFHSRAKARTRGDPDPDRVGRARVRNQRSVYRRVYARLAPSRGHRGLRLLVHDPSLVSRTMVEDVLRYKRLDGVPAALAGDCRGMVPRRPASLDLDDRSRRYGCRCKSSGGGRTNHPGIACRRARRPIFRFTFSRKPAICRIWKKPAKSIG